jgi:hypothetical protein
VGWPKGKPQSETAKAEKRVKMLARIAAGLWNADFCRTCNSPEAKARRLATNRARGNDTKCAKAMAVSMARPDVRAKLSVERKARFSTPEGRQKILAVARAAQTPEVNERRRAASKAYAISPEGRLAKQRGGLAALHSLRGASARKEWEYQEHRFRSSWERDFARFLDLLGVKWWYEPTVYQVGSRHYVPDFRVEIPGRGSVIVEVKGVRLGRGLEKFQDFVREYPEVPAVLIGDEEIAAIRKLNRS